MLKRILSITMVLMLVLASVSFAFAEKKEKNNGRGNKPQIKSEKRVEVNETSDAEETADENEEETGEDPEETTDENEEEIDEEAEEESDEENEGDKGKGKGKRKGLDKSWKENKETLEIEKDELELVKDELEKELVELEAEYEAAMEDEDEELAAQLGAELLNKRNQFNEAKFTFKTKLHEMKVAIRNTYTEEELESIEEIGGELKEKGMRTLPVESIINKKGKFKFDIPPVIKEGRTLIPVRAISEGFGAEVDWNGENKIVTITKGETIITLKLDDRTATVNGEEVELDAAAELMNNRTVVPLRFIAESLGLTVGWDEETETIELDEEVDEEAEGNIEDTEAIENEEDNTEEENLSEGEASEEEETEESEESEEGTENEEIDEAGEEESDGEILEENEEIEDEEIIEEN